MAIDWMNPSDDILEARDVGYRMGLEDREQLEEEIEQKEETIEQLVERILQYEASEERIAVTLIKKNLYRIDGGVVTWFEYIGEEAELADSKYAKCVGLLTPAELFRKDGSPLSKSVWGFTVFSKYPTWKILEREPTPVFLWRQEKELREFEEKNRAFPENKS